MGIPEAQFSKDWLGSARGSLDQPFSSKDLVVGQRNLDWGAIGVFKEGLALGCPPERGQCWPGIAS